MDYTINELSKISGISARALRYYDQIGLLVPERISSNGYRIYSGNEVDILQQILFYRELGVRLDEIKKLINAPEYDKEKSLLIHLDALLNKQKQIGTLIQNVRKTIEALKGVTVMSDKEKFEGFEKKSIRVEMGRANISKMKLIIEDTGQEIVLEDASQSDMKIVIELARTEMEEKDIADLSGGSIIMLDKQAIAPADVFVNNKRIATGQIVIIEENFGVMINEILDDKMVDALYLDLKSVIETEKKADELLDIFADDNLIAKGTVVVVDEHFAVRLVEVA